jgi:MoxR-like ATPase
MLQSSLTTTDLSRLSARIPQVDLTPILEPYLDLAFKVRDLGIAYSDRRSVKVLKLVAASALLCGRDRPSLSDLWVLRYAWDQEEQIEPLASLVNGFLEDHAKELDRHPLANVPSIPTGDELAQQLGVLEQQLEETNLSLTALGRLRERLTDLADQASWLPDPQTRKYLLDRARQCLQKIGS